MSHSSSFIAKFGSQEFPVEWAVFWGMSAGTRAHTPKYGIHPGNS